MSDGSNGRWVADGRYPRWRDAFGATWPAGDIFGEPSLCLAPPDDRSAARDALVALIEAAESTEPRNQPEPLPLMTGVEIGAAWDRGAVVDDGTVEVLTEGTDKP